MLSENKNSLKKFETSLMKKIVQFALDEDKVLEDITTNSLVEFDSIVKAEVFAKQRGIISGMAVFSETFKMVDSEIHTNILKQDGEEVRKADIISQIEGRESSILRAERTALNFLQRLSGIATTTRTFVEKIKPYNTIILDTRKTTPGMRYLEKKAVRDGGGINHRLNLEEMAMIKDNHIKMAGCISNAVNKIKLRFPKKKIEVEVKNLNELKEALSLDIDFIMLDNFPDEMLKEAVKINKGRIKLEVSGNVTLENIENKAMAGVDFISIGALTHSFKSMDISLEIVSKIDSQRGKP